MKKPILLILSLAAVVAVGPAIAEAQGRGARGPAGPRGAELRGPAGPFSPGMLLRQDRALELTDEQIAQLTELRDGLEEASRSARDAQETHRERMNELMTADSQDLAAIQREFNAGHAGMGQLQWARLEASLRARALLTDEQRGMIRGQRQAAARMRRGAAMRGRGMRGSGRGARGMRRAPRVRP